MPAIVDHSISMLDCASQGVSLTAQELHLPELSHLQATPVNARPTAPMSSILLEDDWRSLGSRAAHPTQGTDSSRRGCSGLGKYGPEGEFITYQGRDGQVNSHVFPYSWPLVLPNRSDIHRRKTPRRAAGDPEAARSAMRAAGGRLAIWAFSLGGARVSGYAFARGRSNRRAAGRACRNFGMSCWAICHWWGRAPLFRTRWRNMPVMSAGD